MPGLVAGAAKASLADVLAVAAVDAAAETSLRRERACSKNPF